MRLLAGILDAVRAGHAAAQIVEAVGSVELECGEAYGTPPAELTVCVMRDATGRWWAESAESRVAGQGNTAWLAVADLMLGQSRRQPPGKRES